MKQYMQHWPLVVPHIIDHAARWHGDQQVICRTAEGPVTISTYADVHRRSKLCALALQQLGVSKGDNIATLAWNTTRHLEAWYGIMGIGAVCHTLNPRLSDKDLIYIINHAEDKLLMSDITFMPILQRILPQCPTLQSVILLTDTQHMPSSSSSSSSSSVPYHCYEELLLPQQPHLPTFACWPPLSEDDPCGLCYTSGTTGNPKGVMYTHRSNFLHALVALQSDALPLAAADVVLPVVPMFHANSWGIAFAAPMVGARLVLPGPALDGPSVYHLLAQHKVTVTAGVPTVWLALLQHMEAQRVALPHLRLLVIGGAAAPRAMIEKFELQHGVQVRHMWGMTELSPLGSLGGLKALPSSSSSSEAAIDLKTSQGRPHIFSDMRLVDDAGRELPCDGTAVGHLQVRGPIVVSHYYKMAHHQAADPHTKWFPTGDVASIDPQGHMRIADRSKDVIKSGGEWISSIEIENLAMGHPKVLEAAVVGVPNERWGERPLLVVVLKEEHRREPAESVKQQLLAHLAPQLAKWAVPDDVAFVAEIPHNATGKVSKMALRAMFKDHKVAASRL